MSKFRMITLIIVTFSVMQVLILFFIHSPRQETLGGIKKHSPDIVSQSKFKPPKTSKPKGSSGAGSRRIFSNERYKNINT